MIPKLFTVLALACFLTIGTKAQGIDSLQLTSQEIPAGYSLTKENNSLSIQAQALYDDPAMYGTLLGKFKTKRIQNFDHKKDKGCIMYFEFENGFKGQGFLDGLLWGGDKPTKEHPEEYYAKGKFLIIWSFKKGSTIAKISKDKIQLLLK